MRSADAWAEGRLLSRPKQSYQGATRPSGTHPLGLQPARAGLLHVPSSLRGDRTSPLLVLLHGAGGMASQMLHMGADQAERNGVLLLAPTSKGGTWDVIRRDNTPDVEYLDRALALVFSTFVVERERIAVGGF